jgi:hypothetical protein
MVGQMLAVVMVNFLILLLFATKLVLLQRVFAKAMTSFSQPTPLMA